jgi:hypothetical protein
MKAICIPQTTSSVISGIIPMVITKRLPPMNKYLIKILYGYTQYGKLYGFVYVEHKEATDILEQDVFRVPD